MNLEEQPVGGADRPALSYERDQDDFARSLAAQRVRSTTAALDGLRLRARELGGPCSPEAVVSALYQVDRVERPYVLTLGFDLGVVSLEALRANLGPVWNVAEYPERTMSRTRWRQYFSRIGFTVDGQAAERPLGPVTLYRGAPQKYRRGMSWTSSLDVARRFAFEGLRRRQVGAVYRATVSPRWILAVTHDREETEHIIDASRLKMEVYERVRPGFG